MADISITVTHSLTIADSLGHTSLKVNPIPCLANDYARTYGRVLIRITKKGKSTPNALAGTVEFPENLTTTVLSKKQAVSHRDLQQSNAMVEVGDVKFRVTAGDCAFRPRKGNVVLHDGEEFEILGVDEIVFATRYLLWCRSV